MTAHRMEQLAADLEREAERDLVVAHLATRDRSVDRILREPLSEHVRQVVALDLITGDVEHREPIAARIVGAKPIPLDAELRVPGVAILALRIIAPRRRL